MALSMNAAFKKLLLSIGSLLLPNLILYGAALQLGLTRPFFNIDYAFWSLLYLITPLYLSIPIFSLIFAIDVLSILSQLFPVFRLADALYLLSFINIAPTLYKFAMLMLCICLIAICWFYISNKKYADRTIWLGCINLLVFAYLIQVFVFPEKENERIWRMKTPDIIDSQLVYNLDTRGDGFVQDFFSEPLPFEPTLSERVTSHQLQPLIPQSNKLLLIIAESWGHSPKEITDDLLAPILNRTTSQKTHQGDATFLGATVAAEMKELCGLRPKHFNIKSLETGFENCLANQLKPHGYATMAMHGAAGTMYDRAFWYPKAGFDKTIFLESKFRDQRCYSFPGACDSDLFNEVKDFFGSNRRGFMYWLTLNTHSPFDPRDIHSNLFDCPKFGINTDSPTCYYFQLHAQFFHQLALLLDSPEMQGVNVLVVGDHMPAILNQTHRETLFEYGHVSWIRIKN